VRRIFAFNGDADGLCALQQLWLAEGRPIDRLVTGPKRRIALLEELEAQAGDEVTALDVSFDVNRRGVERLLERGATVRYLDHHHAGDIPAHPRLLACIDLSPAVCTSVIADRWLGGAHTRWAVVGAFGDNLDETARGLAAGLGLAPGEIGLLKELGVALNYNAYGECEADLHFPPTELHLRMRDYADPLAFVREDSAFAELREGCETDLELARALAPHTATPHAAVYVLPDKRWARRVSGVLAGRLARAAPARAHAVVSPLSDGGWQVSVRAPLEKPLGAAAFCRRYPGGGGREAAAGINRVAGDALDAFAGEFLGFFGEARTVTSD
jgi:hypothetical protein